MYSSEYLVWGAPANDCIHIVKIHQAKIKFKNGLYIYIRNHQPSTNFALNMYQLKDLFFVDLPNASEKAVSNWHSADQGKF